MNPSLWFSFLFNTLLCSAPIFSANNGLVKWGARRGELPSLEERWSLNRSLNPSLRQLFLKKKIADIEEWLEEINKRLSTAHRVAIQETKIAREVRLVHFSRYYAQRIQTTSIRPQDAAGRLVMYKHWTAEQRLTFTFYHAVVCLQECLEVFKNKAGIIKF